MFATEAIRELLIPEYIKGERAWLLYGNLQIEQGFSIFLVPVNEIELYLPELNDMTEPKKDTSISRVITLDQVVVLAKNNHCINGRNVQLCLSTLKKVRRLYGISHPKYNRNFWLRDTPKWFMEKKWVQDNQYHLFVTCLLIAFAWAKPNMSNMHHAIPKKYREAVSAAEGLKGSDKFHTEQILRAFKKEYARMF